MVVSRNPKNIPNSTENTNNGCLQPLTSIRADGGLSSFGASSVVSGDSLLLVDYQQLH